MKQAAIIATAVMAILHPISASAVSLLKDKNNTIDGKGIFGVAVVNTNNETHLVSAGSRVHLDATHKLKDDLTIFGTFEWGVNIVGDNQIAFNNDSLVEKQNSDFFYNRESYVGFKSPKYGSLAFGKLYGAWFDVVQDTDNGAVWDGNAAGSNTYLSDGNVNGVGRAEQAIQYRNQFGGLSVALQMQVMNDKFSMADLNPFPFSHNMNSPVEKYSVEYGNTYGVGLRYKLNPLFTITAGYNRGEFDLTNQKGASINKVDDIYGGGVVFGNWLKPGFFAAANYSIGHNHDVDNIGRLLPETKGLESSFSYLFDNNFRVYVQYDDYNAGQEYQRAYHGDNFERKNVITSLQYQYDQQLLIYVENRTDLSDFKGKHEQAMSVYDDDGVAAGFKYIF
ncbi:porin [Shewanella sp. 202IG2-18]|uniref:porin n=1 Tax=Parashewanella hymeniacidonis TaxID=2807618 RepID=UPI0019603FBF|nr:porin [Parashewanella hymeniacidonis]MBM7071270.1 porin [Parashewanella hymeniacidonis]